MVMVPPLWRIEFFAGVVGLSVLFLLVLGRKLERRPSKGSWRDHLVLESSWNPLKDCSKLASEWSWFCHRVELTFFRVLGARAFHLVLDCGRGVEQRPFEGCWRDHLVQGGSWNPVEGRSKFI